MLFIYVFTLLGSTTVWTQDAKDGKQGSLLLSYLSSTERPHCDIPISMSREPGVTFWST